MGSAFSVPCIDNGNEVHLCGTHLENDLIDILNKNKKFHTGLKTELPNKLQISKFKELKKIFNSPVDIIVVGVSSLGIKWFSKEISKYYKEGIPIILLTKGLTIIDGKIETLSKKISNIFLEKGFKNINISAIKGPCLATGLANKIRTGAVIANKDKVVAQQLKKIISTEYYSMEVSDDIIGVEVAGAIKNIYSMLIGASVGLSSTSLKNEIKEKYFLNTAASLIHRSISEMYNFVSFMGGKPETVYGLAGLGDLYVSAIGGRNSKMGKYLGEGFLYKDAKENFMKNVTVEGAELALEIGPSILKLLSIKDYPLMNNILETICLGKKLKINW